MTRYRSMDMHLETKSLAEKLQMMELLWDDLCKRAVDMASPAWHEVVLDERAAAVARGDESPIDWEAAKKDIRNEVA